MNEMSDAQEQGTQERGAQEQEAQEQAAQGEDAKVEATRTLFIQNTINRPVLQLILKVCSQQDWPLDELEDFILSRDEFAKATQPPYFLIQWLVKSGALDSWEIDARGQELTPDRLEGLSEDEIDDLAVNTVYRANQVGAIILDEFSPKTRLSQLLELKPGRYDTYIEVLEFLQEKHSLAEIYKLLQDNPVLMDGRTYSEGPMLPSVFIDKLSAAGGITFREGWMITEEGKELLDSIK